MAPKRKRTDILASLAAIEQCLPSVKADSFATAALDKEVSQWIFDADLYADTGINDDGDAGQAVEYHRAGVQLWNTVLRVERETQQPMPPEYLEYERLLVKFRVLGLCVMEAGFGETLESCSESKSRCVYLYTIAIRTAQALTGKAKQCKEPAEGEDVKMMRLVLGMACRYQDILSKKPPTDEDEHDGHWDGNRDDIARRNTTVKKLNQERLIFELAQLWREQRFADADELCQTRIAHADIAQFGSNLEIQEHLYCTLFQRGSRLLAQKDFAGAKMWLEKAKLCFGTLGQDGEPGGEAKTAAHKAAMYALALATLGLGSQESLCQAQQLTALLASYPGSERDHRVHILQLLVYDSPHAESFEAQKYAGVLLKVMASFECTPKEFALLHHHIQKLHSKSPGLGCEVLDRFLLELHKRPPSGKTGSIVEWMERLIITRVWLLAHQRQSLEELDAAQTIINKLNIVVRADAAAAAQTVMWKRIEQGYQEKQYAVAMRWCRLALGRMFENGGRSNRPLIERRQLLCAVESGELEAAKTTYARMSEAVRDEPMTKYLVYKLAVRLDDLELAGECLRCIAMSSGDKELLHACLLHSRHTKQPLFISQALKKVADSINRSRSFDFGAGEGGTNGYDSQVYAPALFRCSIIVLLDIIEGEFRGKDDQPCKPEAIQGAVRDLSEMFQGVIDAVEKDRDFPVPNKERLFSSKELEWFWCTAYHIGLKYCGTWELRQTMGLLKSCIKLMDFLAASEQEKDAKSPTETVEESTQESLKESAKEMVTKRLACRFLVASGLAALVRSASHAEAAPRAADTEQIYEDCHAMREHILAFNRELSEAEARSLPVGDGIKYKRAALLVFDFEGAIRLGVWDELETICARVARCKMADMLRVLGDTLMRAQAAVPSHVFVSTMQLVLAELQAMREFGDRQLVRYYRCLFQCALYRDSDAAFELLEKVQHLVEEPADEQGDEQGGEEGDGQAGEQGPPKLVNSQDRQDKRAWSSWQEEMEFMATIAFNEGVDWFAGGRYGQARRWASAAIRLARMCGDGGKLEGVMEARFATLGIGAIGTEGAEAEVAGEKGDGTGDEKGDGTAIGKVDDKSTEAAVVPLPSPAKVTG